MSGQEKERPPPISKQDAADLGLMFKREQRRLVSKIAYLLREKLKPQDYEDVVQLAWEKFLHANYCARKPRDEWSRLLHRIVTNICNDIYRGRMRVFWSPIEVLEAPVEDADGNEIQTASSRAADEVAHKEWLAAERYADQMALIQELVSTLPSQQQKIVELFYRRGLSIRDVAARLHLTEGGVKSTLWQARKNIEEAIGARTKKATPPALRGRRAQASSPVGLAVSRSMYLHSSKKTPLVKP